MHGRVLSRSILLALIATVLAAGVAAADATRADGDAIIPGAQVTIDLGVVPAGGIVTVPVGFDLICAGTSHADAAQVLTLSMNATSAPADGAVLSVTDGVMAPVPDTWATDGSTCPSPTPHWTAGSVSQVTIQAPTAPNVGYTYSVAYSMSITPAGNDDANAIRGSAPAITIKLAVPAVVDQPPTVTTPGDQVVEGDTAGGWVAGYPGVVATDPEDDPDPVPTCEPIPGTVLLLGDHTVVCSATDSAGSRASASFHVTVTDRTPPAIAGVPSDTAVSTEDGAGAAIEYSRPSASDVVDGSVPVSCLPASGSMFPVGVTDVACTAVDRRGNESRASFRIIVTFVPTHVGSAVWLEPVRGGAAFTANHGRRIPVKVVLLIDGVERVSGDARLAVRPCGDGIIALDLAMSFHGGRWTALLDTSRLTGSCYTISVSIDGVMAGSFRLDLRGGNSGRDHSVSTEVGGRSHRAARRGR
jgi:hypothetical protein